MLVKDMLSSFGTPKFGPCVWNPPECNADNAENERDHKVPVGAR